MRKVKGIFSGKNVVVILFILVFTAFSFAKHDSKKLEQLYFSFKSRTNTPLASVVKPGINQANLYPR
jgi:hypothetical protein